MTSIKKDISWSKWGWLPILICLILAYWIIFVGITPAPGAFLEKKDYKARVMVNVFPEGDKSKNYRLEADITRSDGVYFINKIYWPNGGYLEWQPYEGDRCSVEDRNQKTDKLEAYCNYIENAGKSNEKELFYKVEITSEKSTR
jgi:hypothetical protein